MTPMKLYGKGGAVGAGGGGGGAGGGGTAWGGGVQLENGPDAAGQGSRGSGDQSVSTELSMRDSETGLLALSDCAEGGAVESIGPNRAVQTVAPTANAKPALSVQRRAPLYAD